MLGFSMFDEIDKINYELFEVHLKCVQNISQLMNELQLNSLHELFYVFCYLLWNGYFSIDKLYMYNNMEILDENNTIFLGRGCCRHNAQLLAEVLGKMDVYAREVGIRTSSIKLRKMIDIERKVECNVEKSNLSKTDYDHSVTLVSGNKELFILDPTKLTECEIIRNGRVICFNGKYRVAHGMFLNTLKHSLYFDYQFNRRATISKNILIDSYEIAESICKENSRLFDDFFTDNHSNYKEIKRLVLKKINL